MSAALSAGPISEEIFADNLVVIFISNFQSFLPPFCLLLLFYHKITCYLPAADSYGLVFSSYSFSYLSTNFRYKNSTKTMLYTSEY